MFLCVAFRNGSTVAFDGKAFNWLTIIPISQGGISDFCDTLWDCNCF